MTSTQISCIVLDAVQQSSRIIYVHIATPASIVHGSQIEKRWFRLPERSSQLVIPGANLGLFFFARRQHVTSQPALTFHAPGMLSGIYHSTAGRYNEYTSHLEQSGSNSSHLLSNIRSNILLYYPSPFIESMSPEPEPYTRENKAIEKPDNHLWRSVMPQQDPRAGNCAGPRDSDHCNEGAKQRIFRK